MSYTIVDDSDTLNISAVITNRIELAEFVEKLQIRLDSKKVNVTTPTMTMEEKNHG